MLISYHIRVKIRQRYRGVSCLPLESIWKQPGCSSCYTIQLCARISVMLIYEIDSRKMTSVARLSSCGASYSVRVPPKLYPYSAQAVWGNKSSRYGSGSGGKGYGSGKYSN